jgi:hypothetical protein
VHRNIFTPWGQAVGYSSSRESGIKIFSANPV